MNLEFEKEKAFVQIYANYLKEQINNKINSLPSTKASRFTLFKTARRRLRNVIR